MIQAEDVIPQLAEIKTQKTRWKRTVDAELKSTAKTGVKLITTEELRRKMQSGDPPQVVNVSDPKFYYHGFIKGSKRISFYELDIPLGQLDRSKAVVTYCANSECDTSKHEAELLADKGFNVTAYEGGIKEWKEAGLPTEA